MIRLADTGPDFRLSELATLLAAAYERLLARTSAEDKTSHDLPHLSEHPALSRLDTPAPQSDESTADQPATCSSERG